jgi:hypothetical protein
MFKAFIAAALFAVSAIVSPQAHAGHISMTVGRVSVPIPHVTVTAVKIRDTAPKTLFNHAATGVHYKKVTLQ